MRAIITFMVDFQEFIGTAIEAAYSHRHPRSEKLAEYYSVRGRLLLPRPLTASPDFRYTKDFVRAGLAEVSEAISKHPTGVGELQNRGNVTLGAIKTQFERALEVLEFKRRENTSSLPWVLQYGAEQVLAQEAGRGKNEQKLMKERINSNLAKISRDLTVSGIKIETPQLQ